MHVSLDSLTFPMENQKRHTLGERCAHDHSSHAGGGLEVSLAALSPARVQVAVDLRHFGDVYDGVGVGGGVLKNWLVKPRRCRECSASSASKFWRVLANFCWCCVPALSRRSGLAQCA